MRARIAVARWEDIPGETIERYWERLREVGLDPLDLEGTAGRAALDGCHGLVLTGGVDVDPALYGAQRHEKVRRINRERDEFELELLNSALGAGLPLLAICRGHQLLNVALGGSLLQHLESGRHAADYRTEGFPSRSHTVTVDAASRFYQWLGRAEVNVNSRHHQAVTPDLLAGGLRCVALSPDGLVEAVEAMEHAWVIGVQWHPEREEPRLEGFAAAGRALFAAFARAVRS